MFIMFADETNLDASQRVRFFIYGGLIVAADAVGPLSHRIGEIRLAHGFRSQDALKFRSQSRAAHLDVSEWTAAKAEVIGECRAHGAAIIACLILHAIARRNRDRLIDWQLNTVLDKFSGGYLVERNDVGLVVLDRIGQSKEYALMRSKFSEGGETPWGTSRSFDRVVGYSSTCDGASHLASAADVVLGTFGYCVNQRGDLSNPKALFPLIEPLIWRRQIGGRQYVWDNGIVLNPARVAASSYRTEYEELKRHLRALAG